MVMGNFDLHMVIYIYVYGEGSESGLLACLQVPCTLGA